MTGTSGIVIGGPKAGMTTGTETVIVDMIGMMAPNRLHPVHLEVDLVSRRAVRRRMKAVEGRRTRLQRRRMERKVKYHRKKRVHYPTHLLYLHCDHVKHHTCYPYQQVLLAIESHLDTALARRRANGRTPAGR